MRVCGFAGDDEFFVGFLGRSRSLCLGNRVLVFYGVVGRDFLDVFFFGGRRRGFGNKREGISGFR